MPPIPHDVALLWGLVFLRMMGYGLTNQVLTLYLHSLGIANVAIGWFMTATLVGDAMLSLWLTWRADHWGRRRVVAGGCVAMAISGVVFASSSSFWVLLLAAVVGVISPSGDETGPFKSVEEASLAHLTLPENRAFVYAIHGLAATGGAAIGSLVAGLVVDRLTLVYQFDDTTAYRVVFVIYAGIAVAKLLFSLLLSPACEVKEVDVPVVETDESELLLPPSSSTGLSARTQRLLAPLLVVFMLDSLGYGLMPWAWVVYYLKKTFAISATGLGMLFFVINLTDAISSLPSAYIATKLGSVMAILCTQVPSAILFALVSVVSSFGASAILLLGYAATSTLDVVPRQMLLSALFPPHELAKVMGVVNLGKTAARSVGPPFTGWLAHRGWLHYGFAVNGGCVLIADAVLAYFSGRYTQSQIH